MGVDAATLGMRIRAARDRLHVTQLQLAASSSLDRSALAKIESGSRRVTALELARIAAALDVRIEAFVQDPVPAIASYRNRLEPGTGSPALDTVVERITRNVEFLGNNGGLSLPAIEHLDHPQSDTAAEDAARTVRGWMGLDALQPAWDLQGLVERLGLLTFSLHLGPDTADAASIALPSGAVALINGASHVGRRRMSAAHELGHFVFADEYTIDWRVAGATELSSLEGRIDRFARAVLLPVAGITQQWGELRATSDSIRLPAVRVASTFRVDMATLARRLLELGLATSAEAHSVRTTTTTRADIVEYNLLPHDELSPPSLPVSYERAVLGMVRGDVVSDARALDLLLDTWSDDDLPPRPPLSDGGMWDLVS